MGDQREVCPYLLDVETAKQKGISEEIQHRSFGQGLELALSWQEGEQRMPRPIKVAMLGTGNSDDAFYCPPEVFMKSALRLGGEPIFSPPPFAAPCTDGLLIIYTLRRSSIDGVDVHGGFIFVSKEELEEEHGDEAVTRYWEKAQKPSDGATMLRRMGFTEATYYLN